MGKCDRNSIAVTGNQRSILPAWMPLKADINTHFLHVEILSRIILEWRLHRTAKVISFHILSGSESIRRVSLEVRW